MNVGELKAMLDKYPDDMRVISTRMSDYDLVDEDDFSVEKAVDKGFYVMRPHHTMSDENVAKLEDFLHLAGN